MNVVISPLCNAIVNPVRLELAIRAVRAFSFSHSASPYLVLLPPSYSRTKSCVHDWCATANSVALTELRACWSIIVNTP